jgi:hypothetical protein
MVMCLEQETITEFGWTVLPHRSCSLGFPLLWGPKKDIIRGKMFGSDDNVTEEVGKWMRVQNSKWYKRGKEALISRWCKAVGVDGDMQKSEVCNTYI